MSDTKSHILNASAFNFHKIQCVNIIILIFSVMNQTSQDLGVLIIMPQEYRANSTIDIEIHFFSIDFTWGHFKFIEK